MMVASGRKARVIATNECRPSRFSLSVNMSENYNLNAAGRTNSVTAWDGEVVGSSPTMPNRRKAPGM